MGSCGIVLPADGPHHYVPEDGVADSAGMAVCCIDWTAGVEHRRGAVDLGQTLPSRHSDVWEARDSAGVVALAALQLGTGERTRGKKCPDPGGTADRSGH